MKREIRFRAWDNVHKIMRAEFDVTADGLIGTYNMFERYEPHSDWILMQYIGLTDKNGKEIYEGDILKTETGKEMQVSWRSPRASFCIDRHGWAFAHYFGETVDSRDVEVIGNIYENTNILINR